MTKTVIASLLCAPLVVSAEVPARRLNAAAAAISEVMSAPDKGIPLNLLARAQCIVVVPGLKGGAFGVGAKYGKGFFSCHKGGDWSAPASVRVEAGNVGLQIGVVETDLVMLIMNSKVRVACLQINSRSAAKVKWLVGL